MAAVPIIVAVVIGIIVGLARGGRVTALARTRLRALPALAVALVANTVVDTVDVSAPGVWAVVGLLAGLVFAVRNLHLVGMVVVAIGLVVNLAPVALNGAMPVRGQALVDAGMVEQHQLELVVLDGARELADDETVLEPLGDIIPIAITGQVMSFGDLIMLVGLADVIANLLLQRPRRRLPKGAARSLAGFGWVETESEEGGIIDLDEGTTQPGDMSSASPVHDWGTAPPPTPVSGSQYSASPDAVAPATVAAPNGDAADANGSPSGARELATQSR